MIASRYSEAIVVRTITRILTKYKVPADQIEFDNDSYEVRLLLPVKYSNKACLVVNLQNGNFRFADTEGVKGAMIYSYGALDQIIHEHWYSKS